MFIKLKSLKNQIIDDAKKYFITRKYLEKTVENYQDLPEHIFNELKSYFVLSNGRCGTELLVKLFQLSNAGKVVHEPKPQLVYGSKIAYELSNNVLAKKLGFITARQDVLREAYLRNQFYIETNNRITFFADAIYDLLPRSKFIHLIRHPGNFVRSGIRRKYYAGHDYDDGRITPTPSNPVFTEYQNFSQIKRISWLWNETNKYIESLKRKFSADRIITIKAENLFNNPESFLLICKFLNIQNPDVEKIKTILKTPINVQYKGFFPKYMGWSDQR